MNITVENGGPYSVQKTDNKLHIPLNVILSGICHVIKSSKQIFKNHSFTAKILQKKHTPPNILVNHLGLPLKEGYIESLYFEESTSAEKEL